jgi:hypothetical protein
MSKLLLPVTQEGNDFLADFVFRNGAVETAEEPEEEGPAVGVGGPQTMASLNRFFAAEVLELLVDPGSVEFGGEGIEVVENVGREGAI